jgi:hypothetical protein
MALAARSVIAAGCETRMASGDYKLEHAGAANATMAARNGYPRWAASGIHGQRAIAPDQTGSSARTMDESKSPRRLQHGLSHVRRMLVSGSCRDREAARLHTTIIVISFFCAIATALQRP